ncbi:MAG: damage-inducible protein DinB [Proteobacteria bacterium]|nr:damage-inducible protein DinB [Pseudomonadota bacterium]
MLSHLRMMADYNRWANARLYEAVAQLPEAHYRADAGVYFISVHGTLNHLLAGDRIWMHRLQGAGESPRALDAILYEDFAALRAARIAEDERIAGYVGALTPALLEAICEYPSLAGVPQRTPRREILAHLFNHQTHHRGQVHAALTRLGVAEPPPLDLLILQRERAARSA